MSRYQVLGSLLLLSSSLSLACSGESLTSGISEPIRVRYGATNNAQFRSGALPGSRPLSAEEQLANTSPELPSTTLNTTRGVVAQSDTGFALTGTTSSEAVAVGIRFSDLGDGYWVLPVAGQDPALPGTFTWAATADFGAGISPGVHPLTVVAIDAHGHAGTQVKTDLCVASDIPDNLSSCSPGATPPAAVLSLAWDAPLDLDLRVITPQGKVVDSKHPSTALVANGKADPSAPGSGVFDTDAGRACVQTAHLRENLSWKDAPLPGRYFVYVSLYDACKQASVHFTVSLNQPESLGNAGLRRLASSFQQTGELLASDADAGAGLGLFVSEFIVQ